MEDPEKKDKDVQLMHSDKKRIDKFVDFVVQNKNLCKAQKIDVTCADLRKKIDAHKKEAGTEGIEFNNRMTGIGAKIARFLKLQNADVVRPYGVIAILDWILELDGSESNRYALVDEAKFPQDIRDALKFVIKNKDEIWSIIRTSLKNPDPYFEGVIDHRPLAKYLAEHAPEMGFKGTTENDWQAITSVLKAGHVFELEPFNHMTFGKKNYEI